MPGSHVNPADCNMVLNTAVAKGFKDFADALEGATGEEFEAAALSYIKQSLKAHQRIVFNGNGYSEEWEAEAARRGLANNRTTADALPCYVALESIALFETMGVMSEPEVCSRYEVKLEKYNKLVNIEARVMQRMAHRTYLPAINAFARETAEGLQAFKAASPSGKVRQQQSLLDALLEGIDRIDLALSAMEARMDEACAIEDQQERANHNAHVLLPAMERLRAEVDAVEGIVGRDRWPVPSYNNMLFYV